MAHGAGGFRQKQWFHWLGRTAAPVPELLKTRVEKDNAARSCAMTRHAPLHSTCLVGGEIEEERRGAPAPNGLLLC